jgi:hypothetical protein
MSYENPGSIQGRSIDNLADDDILTPITTATLGLLTWNPDMTGCRKYGDKASDLSVAFHFARAVGVIAALFSIVATVNVGVELICCRCCCSRCTSTSLFIMAAITQALTFVVYATDICLKSSTFECGYESGSSLSISAIIFLLISTVMTCSAPKARPLVRLLMELDRNQENDPCCYCFRKDTINRPPPSTNVKQSTLDPDEADEAAFKKSSNNVKATAEPEQVPVVGDHDLLDENGLDDDFYDTERNFVGQQIVVTRDPSGANSVPPDYYYYSSARQSAPNETLPYYATPAANQHTRIRNSMTQPRAIEQGNAFDRPVQYQRQAKVYSTFFDLCAFVIACLP